MNQCENMTPAWVLKTRTGAENLGLIFFAANGFSNFDLWRFIVAIFLANDSIGVWELKTRNSGHDEEGCVGTTRCWETFHFWFHALV